MTDQWTEAQLSAATPEQIAEALGAGHLQSILAGTAEQGVAPVIEQRSEAWLKDAHARGAHEEIIAAKEAGELDALLSGKPND